ncbi:MAG TPA: SRPBCC domain-containing protein [Candidatus Baltobacteraceae bacterium]|nr:SRPBCC domain-containing protein [Candidatus Baltobacteraceae bacterium]
MIVKSVVLRCTPERAFGLFTERAGEWWPADRRHTDDAASTIHIEPAGRFFERARDGTEVELGAVRAFEPPGRLELDWYPGTGRANATRVEVRFEAVEGGTRVTIMHDAGVASAETFARNAPVYARSWEAVLAALATAA